MQTICTLARASEHAHLLDLILESGTDGTKTKQPFCGDYHTRRVAHELVVVMIQQSRASERAYLLDSELTSAGKAVDHPCICIVAIATRTE